LKEKGEEVGGIEKLVIEVIPKERKTKPERPKKMGEERKNIIRRRTTPLKPWGEGHSFNEGVQKKWAKKETSGTGGINILKTRILFVPGERDGRGGGGDLEGRVERKLKLGGGVDWENRV